LKKQTNILIPSYVEGFKCIGGECEDSCCIGWDIDIDKQTFRKYFRTKDSEMKQRFTRHIYRNKESCSKNVDFGRISINDSKWCPFLDRDKLCVIQRKLGEDCLSNVCYSFPRVYNKLNGTYEISLAMSCPEAVRKLFANKDPIKFSEHNMTGVKHVIHSSVDTGEKYWKNTPIGQLPELRTLSIEIIQDRSQPINVRLMQLGFKLKTIAQTDSAFQDTLREQISFTGKYAFQMDFFRYVIESLGVFNEIDSPVFADYTNLVMEGFELNDEKSPDDKTDFYKDTVELTLNPFTEENAYLFEHYLVNSIFQDNFPFSENQDMFDGYIMLVLRYALVRFYLAGIAGKNGKLTIDDVALMIQVHTKIINHHKTFTYNLLLEIKRKQFDNMDFVSLLL